MAKKLTEAQVLEIRTQAHVKRGKERNEVASKYGISTKVFLDIVRKRTYKNVKDFWCD